MTVGGASSPNIAWHNFQYKSDTRGACLLEQFHLCAFSEVVLDDNDLGMHLDHVRPKSKFPDKTFDHTNLLLSAFGSDQLKGIAKSDVFGGHYRGNRYSSVGFISPLRVDCRTYFHYASNGEIQPALELTQAGARKARYSIAILNLNAPLLVARRRRWLEELEQAIDLLLAAPQALDFFAEAELCDTQGILRPFHSAVRQRFGVRGESIIRNNGAACG